MPAAKKEPRYIVPVEFSILERREAWHRLANSKSRAGATLAKEVLLDFLSCFLSDDELEKIGVNPTRGTAWLEKALRKAEEVRHGNSRRAS